jgi:hypothetical protein
LALWCSNAYSRRLHSINSLPHPTALECLKQVVKHKDAHSKKYL